MEREFWLERWQDNRIAFHQADVSPLLARYWPDVGAARGSTVFVPLCGKSLDMRYLESLGHHVVGVEMAAVAIEAYFAEAGETAENVESRNGRWYCGPSTRIYCGDVFDLRREDLADVGAVVDRAAWIALPPETRPRYAEHVLSVVPRAASILLIALEYDQTRAAGPPFCVLGDEVEAAFGGRRRVERLGDMRTTTIPPRFRDAGIDEAVEAAYLIAPGGHPSGGS